MHSICITDFLFYLHLGNLKTEYCMEMYVGLMSGTSMDGIDAVLASFEAGKLKLIASHNLDFPPDLQQGIQKLVTKTETSLKRLGEIDHQLAICYANAVNQLLDKAHIVPGQVAAIGCHGQTVFHAPGTAFPFTMQLGDGNLLAARTGITTVTDFRRMDMAYGGQGAPLVPAFHQSYLHSPIEKRCILNLGGIANITILSDDESRVAGFDTGPANCLLDSWIQKVKAEKYDKNGDWARSGKLIPELLNLMLEETYFALPAPKSTGRELFNLNWLKNQMPSQSNYDAADIQATLTELTAMSVARAIEQAAPTTEAVYVCGGGANNGFLLERLSIQLKGKKLLATEELGVPARWMEAMAFAWLAMRRIHKLPGNLPVVTGASRKAIIGTIYEPSAD